MDAKPLRLATGLMLSALICFLLPFALQHPSRSEAQAISTLDFLQGTSLHGLYGEETQHGPDIFINLAVLSTLSGFIVALYPGLWNQRASSILAAFACGCLLYIPCEIDLVLAQ